MATLLSTNRSEIENNEIIRYNDRYVYRKKDLLGSGSYGCVYKVKDETDTDKMFVYIFNL
jgi:hypothetical protein